MYIDAQCASYKSLSDLICMCLLLFKLSQAYKVNIYSTCIRTLSYFLKDHKQAILRLTTGSMWVELLVVPIFQYYA